MEIIYKPVPGFEDYKISEYGEIISYKYKVPKKLKSFVEPTGYRVISLCSCGKYTRRRIHQWVALSFIPNPQNFNEINHINADKTNNHYKNLEWCDHTHNIRHSFALGLVSRKKGSDSHTFDKGRKVILNGNLYNSVASAARASGKPRTSLSGELRGNRENKSGIYYLVD